MKKKWYATSDWHIGHENVLKFCDRPFKDTREMAYYYAKTWNKYVRKNDIGYFAGDMVWKDMDFAKEIIQSLNGTKVLIVGNHDRGYDSMYNLGFDVVVHAVTLFIGRVKITINHYPLLGIKREDTSNFKNPNENWHGENRNMMRALSDEGQIHLHGHIHSPNGGISQKILGRQYDLGVDANKGKPVSSGEIEGWIKREFSV